MEHMEERSLQIPKNRYRNTATAVEQGMKSFSLAREHGLMDQYVRLAPNDRLVTGDGHQFVNFSSCNYLGLHTHPKIIEGAAEMIREEGFMCLSISMIRVCSDVHHRLEEDMSDLFDARCVVSLSCTSASEGILPLLACGALTENERPVMVFDKHSHFSMAIAMPMCGDETEVLTCKNNDLNFLEDMCRKYKRVAYVADGAYSMGGYTLMKDLMDLQDRYGLFLYLDDSHSLSLCGPKGGGFVRTTLNGPINDHTIIVGSLAKAFGASGGVVMMGENPRREEIIRRMGGPFGWSQNLSTANVGAVMASAKLHRSPLLSQLQENLKQRLELFDQLIETPQAGSAFPIRLVAIGAEEKAVEASSRLYKRGFYSSAVFFPIVAKGKAGVRVMLRANHRLEDVTELVQAIKEVRVQVLGA